MTTRRSGVEIQHGHPTIRLTGEVDVATAPALAHDLERATGVVCIDLSGVTFMDSMGARVMLNGAKGLQDGGCVVVHGSPPPVQKLFLTLGMDRLAPNLHILDGHAPSGTQYL
jgi:anti-anti-sigma factor